MRAGERGRREGGFTYMGVVFLVGLAGLGLAGAGSSWSLASQRERERELLWVGNQYARALKAYHDQSPGTRQYPSRLEDLVEDKRFAATRHHLRRLYADPVTREPFEVVLHTDGRVAGVRSRSAAAPLKQDNFPFKWRNFKDTTRYSDWHFIADGHPSRLPPAPAAAASAPK